MGRWAQSRRRGGGPGGAAAPPPPPLPAVDRVLVEPTLGGCRVQFTLPVTMTVTGPDGSFTVDGMQLTPTFQPNSTEIDCSMDTVSGDTVPWDCSSQPPWIVETIVTPASGTTEPA